MKVLGVYPVQRSDHLSGIWKALSRRDDVDMVSVGTRHKMPMPMPRLLSDLGTDFDLVLLADPGRKGSGYHRVGSFGPSTVVATFYTDCWYGYNKMRDWAAEEGVDLLFVRQRDELPAAREAMSCRVEWLPFGVDPDVFRPWPVNKEYDVSIWGQRGGGLYPSRMKMWRLLTDGAETKSLGFSFHDGTTRGGNRPALVNDHFARALCRSRIAVEGSNAHHYWCPKHLEIPACGVPMVCNRATHGFEDVFRDGENCFIVSDPADEMIDLLRRLLKQPKRLAEVAERGRRTVLLGHTIYHRAIELLGKAYG